jgi:amino acid adenylation domain-containing protein
MSQAQVPTFGCGTASLEQAGGRACGARDAARSLAPFRTIPERLHALARLHPERPALFDAETSLTYRELDRAVDSVAAALIEAGGRAVEPVMLVAGVDNMAVIMALGVMRAGKHFMAVEPTFPKAQIAGIARDLSARLALASPDHEALAIDAVGANCRLLGADAARRRDVAVAFPALVPDAVALLNCTSGSTGTPKAVVHTHASALSQATRYAESFLLGEADRLASFGSLAWAGSCWDVFGPLCVGATAALYDIRRHGLHFLPDWLEQTGATVLSGMTAIRAIAREFPERRLDGVRLIQLGGDTVYRVDVQRCQRNFPNALLAVGFGTTETGRATQHFVAPGIVPQEEVLPIGFALPGVKAWIADDDGSEAQAGALGEIVIEADDLAAGYHGRPALTAEKFRHDPADAKKRAYRTGDLGRRLLNGALQHLGRKDFQIKIRGYQVPANEIEALLLASAGVREACVVAHGPPAGQQTLVAFVVRERASAADDDTVLAPLRGALPEYMVPQRLIELPALPRTPTGKTDRKALQEMPLAPQVPDGPRTEPRNAVEARVAAIWREVLGIGELGVDDPFLDLGGDSLQAMQIAGRVYREFGLAVSQGQLLSRPTIAEMAALVVDLAADRAVPCIIPKARQRT